MIVFFTLVTFFLSNPTLSKCFTLIDQGKVEQAESLFRSLTKSNSFEYQYLDAYFKRDSQHAINVYENLYSQTSLPQHLRERLNKKLHDYYHALGYYGKASHYKSGGEATASTKTSAKPQQSGMRLLVQCGVFSSEQNAQLLKEKIATKIDSKVYLTRDALNGNSVYRVVVGIFASYQEAEQVKAVLKREFDINGFIKSEN